MNEHQELIRKLMAVGLTQTEIAKCIGRSQSWVSSVLNGMFKDIKWAEAKALRELAAAKVGAGETASNIKEAA